MSMYQPHPVMSQMMIDRYRQMEEEEFRRQLEAAQQRQDAYEASQQRADQITAGEQAPPEAAGGLLSQFVNNENFDADKLAAGGMKLAQMGMEKPAAAQMAPSPLHRPQGGQRLSINPMQFQFRGLLA